MIGRKKARCRPARSAFVSSLLAGMLAAGCGKGGEPEEKATTDPFEAGRVARGRELFVRHGCPVCHGEEGRGDGRIAESLKPPPRNFRYLSAYRQGSGIEEIARTIGEGVAGGSTMPAYPHLSGEERETIAFFISHLQKKP